MVPYKPKYPDNIIPHIPSSTIITTGWSDRNKVYRTIADLKFAAIGNLYSVAGIGVLIRNLAHNYQITRLIHLAQSPLDQNVPTTETLIGVWQGSDYPGIDQGVLIEVVSRVKLFVVHSVDRMVELLAIDRGNDDGYWYPNISYPISEPPTVSLDGGQYHQGLVIRGNDLTETWYRALDKVFHQGVSVRGGHGLFLEVGSVMATFPMWAEFSVPDPFTEGQLDRYCQTVLTMDVQGDSYTYGQRIGGQLQQIATALNRDPNSTRAVISLRVPNDLDSPNPPCLTSITFQIRDDQLMVKAVFRSHDMWGGWYPNCYAVIQLAKKLLTLVPVDRGLGWLTVVSESAHIYAGSLPEVQPLVKKHRHQLKLDPVGDFVVVVNNGQPLIDHYEAGGLRKLATYPDPGAVLAKVPTIETAHYGYLCREFTRAQILGSEFVQDRG